MRLDRIALRRFLVLMLLAGTGALFGCSGPGPGKLAPVSGKVTVNGQLLPAGSVSFRPEAARGNTSPYQPAGDIDATGTYTLYTNGQKGAPPGHYKVLVTAHAPPDPNARDPYAPRPSYVNPKYNRLETTDLQVEIVEEPGRGYDLALKP